MSARTREVWRDVHGVTVVEYSNPMDWSALESIDEAEARRRFQRHDALFEQEKRGCFVDPLVFTHRGAIVLPPGRYRDLTLSVALPAVHVAGDLVVEGVLEQPFRSSPLWIEGDLEADHLVTCGYIAVRGSVRVAGVLYGNCTNYCTLVYGDFASEHLILEKNHHFAAMGEERATERLEDEEDGYEATEAWMNARGLESHDETGLAAALRASKGIA